MTQLRYYSDGIAIQRMGEDAWSCWCDAGNAGAVAVTIRSRLWIPFERLPAAIDSVIQAAELHGVSFHQWAEGPSVFFAHDAQDGLPDIDLAAIADAQSRRLGWREDYKQETLPW